MLPKKVKRMKPFNEFVKKGNTSIGLFPGAFKPPHKGHFETVKRAALENNKVVVLISAIDRDRITVANSSAIWNIYKPYLPKNVTMQVVGGSPVTAIYQIVDILNNGQFTPTPRSAAPLPDAQSIGDTLLTEKLPTSIKLYASKEDMGRYNAFFEPEKSRIYKGRNVSNIEKGEVVRIASATEARQALKEKNYEKFQTYLPKITKEDKLQVYKMLTHE